MRDRTLDDFELRIFAITGSVDKAWKARLFIEDAIDHGKLSMSDVPQLSIEWADHA